MMKLLARINRKFLLAAGLLVASVWPIVMLGQEGISAVKTETLLRTSSSWNNVPYTAYPAGSPEITVLRITVPAHGELPWHSHPMSSFAYILSGEITVEDKQGDKKHFTAGQVMPETVHTAHRGLVGDNPTTFIVFYAATKGMPLSQPAN